ncbi:MAG: YggS family pyridoxal phosphate-dependent enzyme [Pseudomonadota bacterium]|nr:MAG: YggS family pyridoxal phosphate-dependent enzyme [Pseudomonadota bacterium]
MNQIVSEQLAALRRRINRACLDSGRSPESVQLLAVSKKQPTDAIQAAAAQGQCRFGENYADEGVTKITRLGDPRLEWHFIGPVQSNKTRLIAEHFDWVQSVDRAKIVRRLNAQRPEHCHPLQVLIQVNLDDEPQKAGCAPEHIPALAAEITTGPRLRLRGLMAIPAPRNDPASQHEAFARLRALYEGLKREQPDIDTLSAGMSSDLEAAIAAGATMVRVGTALFGSRD